MISFWGRIFAKVKSDEESDAIARARIRSRGKGKKGDFMPYPAKYRKYYARDMCEYFARYLLDEDYDKPQTDRHGNEYKRHRGLPTFTKFAKKIGVSERTLGRWAADADKPEFAAAYERCRDYQKDILIDRGLEGSYNSKIVSLLLGAVYDISADKGDEDGGNIYILAEDADFESEGE